MIKTFSLLIAIAATGTCLAQTGTSPAPVTTATFATAVVPEDILVLKETEYDFGKIPQGKPVTHVFDIRNKSNDVLKIGNVVASCGCTTPEWEKDKPVAPGTGTSITVGYNASAEGPFNKQFTHTYKQKAYHQVKQK